MAIGYDAFSEDADAPASSGDKSWTHPGGTPAGALILIASYGSSVSDEITTVSYGGVSCTELTLSPYFENQSEDWQLHAFSLDSSVPSGNQTVAVSTSASSFVNKCFCITFTSSGNIEIVDTSTSAGSSTAVSCTVSPGGVSAIGVALVAHGVNAGSITADTGFTSRFSRDNGTWLSALLTSDSASTTDIAISGAAGSGASWQLFGVAISEAAGGITAPVNQTSETDSAQAITSVKIKALGQATESDSAAAITAPSAITAALLQAVETDAAQALSRLKRTAAGQASETDTAQAITPARRIAVGQVVQTNTAQAATSIKRLAVNPASETDSANAVSVPGVLTIAVGQVTEAEFAQAIAAYKRLGVLQPVEEDSAHSISVRKVMAVGQADETDNALAITLEGAVMIAPSAIASIYFEQRSIAIIPPDRRIASIARESRIKPRTAP